MIVSTIRDLLQTSQTRWQLYIFCFGILIYAIAGRPTPDSFGIAEGIVLLALLCALRPGYTYGKIMTILSQPAWFSCGVLLLLWGILMAGWGIMYGHAASSVMRDVVAFAFLMMPLLYAHLLHEKSDRDIFIFTMVLSGVILALRSIEATVPLSFWPFLSSGLDYFSNLPSVLFAGLMMLWLTMKRIMYGARITDILVIVICLCALLVILLAFSLHIQRASLAAVALFGAIIAAMAFWNKPYRSWRLFALLIPLAMVSWPVIGEVGNLLHAKTQAVGANMRVQEWMAVWDAINDMPLSIAFGLGWGGVFQSPAVGGLPVTFTHGLLSSALLKTGVIGFLLMMIYVGLIAWRLVYHYSNPIAQALLWPILICTFLYASFKSLDFGLVLLLSTALWVRNS